MELQRLNFILIAGIVSFIITFLLYPFFIRLLKKLKAWKLLRDDATSWWKAEIFNKLHEWKTWTPTMWAALILFVTFIIVFWSVILEYLWYINYSLFNQRETYIILFAFFSMGLLWLLDDFLNIKWIWKVKWLTAKMKLIWMFLFSAFIAYWFFVKLNVDYIILWQDHIYIGFFYAIITFIFTVKLVNAVNITDWLDGLAWGILIMILLALGIMTYFQHWYIATTVISVIASSLVAFLRYNINPAKVFMWDSGSLAFWWLLASVIYLLWIKLWIWTIMIPLLLILFIELWSSFIQIFSKKVFKKKVFKVAPFHHNLEYAWYAEHTIVMKLWLIQIVLTILSLLLFFYQISI